MTARPPHPEDLRQRRLASPDIPQMPEEMARDLCARIVSAGLVVPVEAVRRWTADQAYHANHWADRAAKALKSGSGELPPVPTFFPR